MLVLVRGQNLNLKVETELMTTQCSWVSNSGT